MIRKVRKAMLVKDPERAKERATASSVTSVSVVKQGILLVNVGKDS